MEKMRTILLDEEVRPELKEPNTGLQLKENYGRSEPTTERTLSHEDRSVHVSQKDWVNGGIS